MALLRVLAVAALVFVVTRWLRKALSKQTGKSSPSGKPWWDGQKRQTTDTKPKLTTLDFKRGPHDILGVEKGASMSAIEAAENPCSPMTVSAAARILARRAMPRCVFGADVFAMAAYEYWFMFGFQANSARAQPGPRQPGPASARWRPRETTAFPRRPRESHLLTPPLVLRLQKIVRF